MISVGYTIFVSLTYLVLVKRTRTLQLCYTYISLENLFSHDSTDLGGVNCQLTLHDYRNSLLEIDPLISSISQQASTSVKPCWICGGAGNSGEHKTKRSDLKAAFGEPTQATPFFFHDGRQKNRRVRSLDARLLKSPDRICHHCNTTRTQPHDRAWETFSEYLRTSPKIVPGTMLRFNRIFPYDTRKQVLNLHLYFVKIFGCLILEGSLRIDMDDFADAIMRQRHHPLVHLKFGRPSDEKPVTVGRSDVWAWPPTLEAPTAFATWFYTLPHLWVNVMFAVPGQKRDGLVGSWRPAHGSRTITIADFRYANAAEAENGTTA